MPRSSTSATTTSGSSRRLISSPPGLAPRTFWRSWEAAAARSRTMSTPASSTRSRRPDSSRRCGANMRSRNRAVGAWTIAAAAIAISLGAASAGAQAPEAFFKGRQITFLIGAGAGGGYDAYYRTFARHVVHHIPGEPTIVPKNMPAASGLAAANTLYTAAERDGATIGAFPNNIPMDPLFGNPGARYDPRKLNWLGSIGKLENICATWITSTVKTIAQAREREVVVAAAAATSNSAIMPKVLNALLGTRFKPIMGYDPGSGMTLALESGETEGVCGLSWSTIKAARPHWIKDNKLNVIVQLGLAKLPELPDVPAA